MMTHGEPEPIRMPPGVLAALLFDGGRVFPSSPFAFLEDVAPADRAAIDQAVEGRDRAGLERALEVLRRPERAVIMLTWGTSPQRRTTFVGREGTFVLAFAAPTGDCLISLPIDGTRMAEYLRRDIGWAEEPSFGELGIAELPSERLEVFSLEIHDDRPPEDSRQMTRAAFAGSRGERVMVVPLDEPDLVEVVALHERDLAAAAALLLGLAPPDPHPPPTAVIEMTVDTGDDLKVHLLYVFESEVVTHRMSSAAYAVDRISRDELVGRVAQIGHLRGDGPAGSASFRVPQQLLEGEDRGGLPQALAEILDRRRALVVATSTTRAGDEVTMVELSWIDAGDKGLWRIEPGAGVEVSIEQTTAADLAAELVGS